MSKNKGIKKLLKKYIIIKYKKRPSINSGHFEFKRGKKIKKIYKYTTQDYVYISKI